MQRPKLASPSQHLLNTAKSNTPELHHQFPIILNYDPLRPPPVRTVCIPIHPPYPAPSLPNHYSMPLHEIHPLHTRSTPPGHTMLLCAHRALEAGGRGADNGSIEEL